MKHTKLNLTVFGFTLVELLVVISIIGVLATVVLVSFGPIQKQARDVQRKSDLNQYRTILENYANQHGDLYPVSAGASNLADLCESTLGLTNCPTDPKVGTTNYYVYTASATSYVIYAILENTGTTTVTRWIICSDGKLGASTASFPYGGACPL